MLTSGGSCPVPPVAEARQLAGQHHQAGGNDSWWFYINQLVRLYCAQPGRNNATNQTWVRLRPHIVGNSQGGDIVYTLIVRETPYTNTLLWSRMNWPGSPRAECDKMTR